MMHRKGFYNTATIVVNKVEAQLLEIPYRGKELSLFILLPKDDSYDSLQKVMNTFVPMIISIVCL